MARIQTNSFEMGILKQELLSLKNNCKVNCDVKSFQKEQGGKAYLELIISGDCFFLLGMWNTYSYQKNIKLLEVAKEVCKTLDIAKANKKLEYILRSK